jgi:hypothetical protein
MATFAHKKPNMQPLIFPLQIYLHLKPMVILFILHEFTRRRSPDLNGCCTSEFACAHENQALLCELNFIKL